jgi:hypothetical protein
MHVHFECMSHYDLLRNVRRALVPLFYRRSYTLYFNDGWWYC